MIEHEIAPIPRLQLPDLLRQQLVASGVDVALNPLSYPLLQREFSPAEQAVISRVKGALLDVPLTHSTHDPDAVTARGVLPYCEVKAEKRGNTGQLDVSLGLDTCTFMYWGAIEKKPNGRHHALIDTHRILTNSRCFVTPFDINHVAIDVESPFIDLREDWKTGVVNEYFKKILSGNDWLELQARKIFLGTQHGEAVNLTRYVTLGEIKFAGPVPVDAIMEIVGPEDEHSKWVELYKKGFVVSPIGRKGGDYDKSPQDLGLAGNEASEFWRSLHGATAAAAAIELANRL